LAQARNLPPTRRQLLLLKTKRMDSNLRPMALILSAKSHMFSQLAKRLGPKEASAAVTREIDRLLPRYQSTWEKNLAEVYAQHFSAEELVSLTTDGKASKYMPKFNKKSNDVRKDMKESSEQGVFALSTLAMTKVWSRSGNATLVVE
jgi:5,10-methenyltetrahydromethanopterin hydrogenase